MKRLCIEKEIAQEGHVIFANRDLCCTIFKFLPLINIRCFMLAYLPCYNKKLYDQLAHDRMCSVMLRYFPAELVHKILNDHTGDFALTGSLVLEALVGPFSSNEYHPDLDIISTHGGQSFFGSRYHFGNPALMGDIVHVLCRNDFSHIICYDTRPYNARQYASCFIANFAEFNVKDEDDEFSLHSIDSILLQRSQLSLKNYVNSFDYGFCRNYFIPGKSPKLVSFAPLDIIKKTSTVDLTRAYVFDVTPTMTEYRKDRLIQNQPDWYKRLQKYSARGFTLKAIYDKENLFNAVYKEMCKVGGLLEPWKRSLAVVKGMKEVWKDKRATL